MSFANKKCCFAILLALIVSHLAFSAHLQTHTANIQGGCEMCTGHGDPSHALAQSIVTVDPAPALMEAVAPIQRTVSSVAVFEYRPRGPPVQF